MLELTGVSVVEVIPRNNEITSFVFWSQVRDFHARSSCRNNLTWASAILASKLLQSSQSNISVQKKNYWKGGILHREPATYSYFNRAIPKNELSTDVFRHLPSCSKLTENAAAEFSPCIFSKFLKKTFRLQWPEESPPLRMAGSRRKKSLKRKRRGANAELEHSVHLQHPERSAILEGLSQLL
jgi:hypothetical protein